MMVMMMMCKGYVIQLLNHYQYSPLFSPLHHKWKKEDIINYNIKADIHTLFRVFAVAFWQCVEQAL